MNKQEFIKEVAKKLDQTQKDTGVFLDVVLETIVDVNAQGEAVKFFGFGTFEPRERKAREGHNPKKLQELKEQGLSDAEAKEQAKVHIPETIVPAFKPAQPYKDSVANQTKA